MKSDEKLRIVRTEMTSEISPLELENQNFIGTETEGRGWQIEMKEEGES